MNADRAAISRGEIVGGHYRLERILAEGGMGVVWAARDLRLGRSVAIKFLGANALSNPIQRERFAREAQLASKIRSPHVVQIIGDGMTDSGVPFVVMELLDGECLAAFLAREGRCSLATCGSIVEQICRALSSAHSLGLVHRDIKPANIFLTPLPGGEVFVRLLDFGIAKELHFGPSGLTRAGELLGSTDYMSPEQFRKPEAVSAATDIWSLGVVVYQMLTGKLPFDESTFPSLAVRVAPGSFPPPSAVFPGLPAEIDEIVLHALAIHPSQRYATVDEFGAEFLRVVRAHISLSVVRADIVRVYEEDGLPDYVEEQELRTRDRPTLQVRPWAPFWGVVLVALCGMVLIGSFMVLERSERGVAAGETRAEHVEPPLVAAASGAGRAPTAERALPPTAAPQPLSAAPKLDSDPLPSPEGAQEPSAQPAASALVGAPDPAPPNAAPTSVPTRTVNAAPANGTNPSAPGSAPSLPAATNAPAVGANASANSASAPGSAPGLPAAPHAPAVGANASANSASANHALAATASATSASGANPVQASDSRGVAPEARARAIGEPSVPASAGEAPARHTRVGATRERPFLSPQPTAASSSEAESKYGF